LQLVRIGNAKDIAGFIIDTDEEYGSLPLVNGICECDERLTKQARFVCSRRTT
jgi:hypothetical protein